MSEHIGILFCPEPDWLFMPRIVEEANSYLLSYTMIISRPKGEELDRIACVFGFRRRDIVDYRHKP